MAFSHAFFLTDIGLATFTLLVIVAGKKA